MSEFFSIAASRATPISLEFEPVYNILNSIALLSEVEQMPALDTWVVRTAAELTPEQFHTNRLIFAELIGALLPDRDWPDFPAYLAGLTACAPDALRDRALRRRAEPPVDATLRAEASPFLNPPPALHDLLVTHLRTVWEGGLADEWRRVHPFLHRIPAVVTHKAAPDAAAISDNLRTFIAGPACGEAGVEQIICAPSPHVGRYIT